VKHFVLSVLVIGVIGGCGADDDSSVAETTARASASAKVPGADQMTRCRDQGGASLNASGWTGSVAGLSCREAGRLILNRFAPDFGRSGTPASEYPSIRNSDPASFRSAGFRCSSYPLVGGLGWHLICGRPGEALSFYLTP
jgi:hypothetical protein